MSQGNIRKMGLGQTSTRRDILKGISRTYRAKVLAEYKRISQAERIGPITQAKKAIFADAIFSVENDLEHRSPNNQQVEALNIARNRLYDDMGFNETQNKKGRGYRC